MSERTGTVSRSDWLIGTIKQNPEGLLLLAAGAVLLMRRGSTVGRAMDEQRISQMEDPVTKATAEATDYVSGVTDRAKETAGSIVSSASRYVEDAHRTIADGSDRVIRRTRSTYHGIVERVLRDQPLLVPLAGLAAGAALAAAFPSSDFEKQTLGPVGAKVTEAASKVGAQLKEAAGEAGEKLKNAADERGLNSEGLKKVASEVAGTFSSSMTGEPSQRRSQTGSAAPVGGAGDGRKG